MDRRAFLASASSGLALLSLKPFAYVLPEGDHMLIEDLRQPPLNTTLMGVVKGVADFYRIPASAPMLFGATGHAFMMNIHNELCPSGPYCWNRKPFFKLLRNVGVAMTDRGFYSAHSGRSGRKRIESLVMRMLNRKTPCALVNMEYQLITGYDEKGLVLSSPWNMDFPPNHLTFEYWNEFGGEVHVNFFTFSKIKGAEEKKMVVDSLAYALDIYDNPSRHTAEPYSVGKAAYTRWINAVEKGQGGTHGNWWNATVWSECRSMAAQYLSEIAQAHPQQNELAGKISAGYSSIAGMLQKVSDKQMDPKEKIELLRSAAKQEEECIGSIRQLLAALTQKA
jgi:hypothetical protein